MLLLLIVMLPFSVYAQDITPVAAPTEFVQHVRVNHEGVQFTFDAQLADSVAVASYPAAAQPPSPAYTEFTFEGYGEGTYLIYAPMPRIDIFTIEDFGPYPDFIVQLDELSRLLAERPDLNRYAVANTADPAADALPFLPLIPAAQVFRAKPEYIEVAGIKGIRYLVYYSQAMNPIIEGEVFYTFQGITDDGQHYVSVILPVNTWVLPPETQPSVDPNTFAAEYQQYLIDILGRLVPAQPESFTPALSTLDALTQSITVNR
jgi:hypothetical protein